MGEHRILLDCGLTDFSAFPSSAPPVDWVFCTHAHADHAQGLLSLHRRYPDLPIYLSDITAKLVSLNWSELPDGKIPGFCQVLPWQTPIYLADNFQVALYPAGHLPGATVLSFTYETPQRTYTLLYTGDFFISNSRLVDGLAVETLKNLAPDVLIIEGSYGNTRHIHRRQQENQLMERISRALASGENILLPVPPLGLAQEILVLLRSHHQFTGQDVDIWVDGQISTVCDIYLELLPHLRASVQNFARHQPLFWDDRVRPRMRRYPHRRMPRSDFPHIVVTELTADLNTYLNKDGGNWLILLPENPRIPLNPDDFLAIAQNPQVRLETYLLSQHSDGLGTTQLIHNLRPQHVIFVHGSPAYLQDLTNLEELQNRYHLHTPSAGTLVELPIGDTFIQPAPPPENHYEGQVQEREQDVNFVLPNTLTHDPRWSNFADTGIVEAHWQGEELVLRGVSQREILSQSNQARIPVNIDCCGTCLFWHNHRCNNPASPLYQFQVTPEGYCPVFERADIE
jgi:Cft2 family RNA processing exonuclease